MPDYLRRTSNTLSTMPYSTACSAEKVEITFGVIVRSHRWTVRLMWRGFHLASLTSVSPSHGSRYQMPGLEHRLMVGAYGWWRGVGRIADL